MNFCPNCGAELKTSAKYCPECGSPLDISEKAAVIASPRSKSKRPKLMALIVVLAIAVIGYYGVKLIRHTPSFSDSPESIEMASNSVVLLYCYDKNGDLSCTGSAFAALEDGVFITNYHVIEQDVYSVTAYTEDEVMFDIGTVVAYDKQKDIAILSTNANVGITPLSFGNSDSLEKGEKVVAIGSPLGFLNTVSTGVFSGYNNLGYMNELQFSASISSGSSGGALFNNSGEVIGITSATYTKGQNINAAVPISEVLHLWDKRTTSRPLSYFYKEPEPEKVEEIITISEFRANYLKYIEQTVNIYGYPSYYDSGLLYISESADGIGKIDIMLDTITASEGKTPKVNYISFEVDEKIVSELYSDVQYVFCLSVSYEHAHKYDFSDCLTLKSY